MKEYYLTHGRAGEFENFLGIDKGVYYFYQKYNDKTIVFRFLRKKEYYFMVRESALFNQLLKKKNTTIKRIL